MPDKPDRAETTHAAKNLPRLYTARPLKIGEPVFLEAAQSHYLRNVMRLGEGRLIRLFNGQDGEFTAKIAAVGKKETCALPEDILRPPPAGTPDVRLLFAPLKKTRLDILIEKAVELGATHLHPILTERTENRKINEERLEAQIIEALEQCERLIKPQLHPLQKLEKLLPAWQGPPILSCLEREDAPPLLTTLESSNTQGVSLLIGPEGGFSPKEIAMITASKACRPVSLGPAILRAETAALYALSLVSAQVSSVDRKSSGGAQKIR